MSVPALDYVWYEVLTAVLLWENAPRWEQQLERLQYLYLHGWEVQKETVLLRLLNPEDEDIRTL